MARSPKGSTPTKASSDVSFIADWNDLRAFSDLDGIAKVDDPDRMLEQWRSDPIPPGLGGVEATVGRLETAEASILPLLARHSRAVCRVSVPSGPYTDFIGERADAPWVGTGFLVSPNLLLTNHHVLNSVEVAEAATVEFNYQITEPDLLDGPPDSVPAATVFRLNPRRLFVTSPMTGFDYSFVWIEPAAAQAFGAIRMTRGSFTVRQTEPTYIIHHPNGAPKQVSLDDTEVLSLNSSAVLYAADTAGGSSGAPVFCKRGRLVALHHAWRRTRAAQALFPTLTGRLNDGGHTDVVNEGIKLSAIAIDLEGRVAMGGEDASAAASVLSAFSGSDTLTGLFGSLGRHGAERGRDAERGAERGAELSPYEKVVQIYRGSEMDIDIGAWNIEWFNRNYKEPGKLDRVAKIITDLNLDIWALVEVSREAVDALVETLQKRFKQQYRADYSEPDAGSGKQATAVLWRPNVVEGGAVPWPDEIDELLRKSSREDLPFEAVHGKIFNRYPGLFRFRLKSETKAFDFYLVPLHLKARGEGSLRRRLASRVLSYAVERMIDTHGRDQDWILLGDVNATLASQDFEPLIEGGFTPLSASDEANGAFTYLKSPYKSLIDNIFVSANLSDSVDPDQFFVVATDRAVSRFVQDVSDHRPIAMRLSLADLPDAPAEGTGAAPGADRDADAAFRALLAAAGAAAPQRATPAAGALTTVSGGTRSAWLAGERTKSAFLRDNGLRFAQEIAATNAALRAQYGADAIMLTAEDVAAIVMAEAGVTSAGLIDPTFVHSNGEHGLLPLPDNIDFWVGTGAPAYDAPMALGDNLQTYLAYLGALKNKPVKTSAGRVLYTDLFRATGIADRPDRGAKLLAGVVHGYFWSGNYADRRVPIEALLSGFAADTPLGPLMQATGYVHAGKPLLEGRQRNLEDGLALAAALRAA
ncbi:MAG: trypsin-like peptidase domain-containing protein [Pseudomonadota bacterium]